MKMTDFSFWTGGGRRSEGRWRRVGVTEGGNDVSGDRN